MCSLEHKAYEKGKLLKCCEVSQEERKAPEKTSLRAAEQVHADLVISIRHGIWMRRGRWAGKAARDRIKNSKWSKPSDFFSQWEEQLSPKILGENLIITALNVLSLSSKPLLLPTWEEEYKPREKRCLENHVKVMLSLILAKSVNSCSFLYP